MEAQRNGDGRQEGGTETMDNSTEMCGLALGGGMDSLSPTVYYGNQKTPSSSLQPAAKSDGERICVGFSLTEITLSGNSNGSGGREIRTRSYSAIK